MISKLSLLHTLHLDFLFGIHFDLDFLSAQLSALAQDMLLAAVAPDLLPWTLPSSQTTPQQAATFGREKGCGAEKLLTLHMWGPAVGDQFMK